MPAIPTGIAVLCSVAILVVAILQNDNRLRGVNKDWIEVVDGVIVIKRDVCVGQVEECRTMIRDLGGNRIAGKNMEPTLLMPDGSSLAMKHVIVQSKQLGSLSVSLPDTQQVAVRLERNRTIVGGSSITGGPLGSLMIGGMFEEQPDEGSVWVWQTSVLHHGGVVAFTGYHSQDSRIRVVGEYHKKTVDGGPLYIVKYASNGVRRTYINAGNASPKDMNTNVRATVIVFGTVVWQTVVVADNATACFPESSRLPPVDAASANRNLVVWLYNGHIGDTCASFSRAITLRASPNECVGINGVGYFVTNYNTGDELVGVATYTGLRDCELNRNQIGSVTLEPGKGCSDQMAFGHYQMSGAYMD